MDRCDSCMTFLTVCPCCGVAFCSDCRTTEDELENQGDEGE